jgi:hypothetical protein
MRVGAVRDDAPFTLLRTHSRAGAVLADVKTCVGTFGDSILDVSGLWAVTADGTRVNATGSENAQAKRAGAGRLKVPVAAGRCRTTTTAFLTREKVTFIQAPGDENVPWRWKL